MKNNIQHPIMNAAALLVTMALGTALSSAPSCLADSLNPLADTYVQNGSTADNSGSANLLVKLQRNPSSNNRVAFLQFDGTGIGGGEVAFASLVLTYDAGSHVDSATTYELFGISDNAANENFNASTLTWDNSGYMDITAGDDVTGSLFYGGIALATATVSAGGGGPGNTVTFSGSGLDDFLNANNNSTLSFVLTSSSEDPTAYPSFASSENTDYTSPTLTYSATPVPEPGSLALLGLGGAGLMLFHGRRQRA